VSPASLSAVPALGSGEAELPEVAAGIDACFGERAAQARWYAGLLAGEAIERGLMGPREADRIWRRHLFNSAVLAPLVPAGATVLDLGSGAGLPGIPVALARPDLTVTLLEPMARRVRFLERCLATLELPNVTVVHARAQQTSARAQVVLARAVAPLASLADLALPLCEPGGCLLALKGRGVAEETAEVAQKSRLDVQILTVQDAVGEPAYIARVTQSRPGRRQAARSARRAASSRGNR
jgi:16S rRNA (guanine527-N7)-methyltransferase